MNYRYFVGTQILANMAALVKGDPHSKSMPVLYHQLFCHIKPKNQQDLNSKQVLWPPSIGLNLIIMLTRVQDDFDILTQHLKCPTKGYK